MNPTTTVAVALLALVFLMIVTTMARSWRERAARDADGLAGLPPVPARLSPARTEPVAGTYVSTVRSGDRMDRVLAHGLGSRSAVEVGVHDEGVLLRRHAATDVFVPVDRLVRVERAAGMAGKVVGGQGLVLLAWTLTARDGTALEVETGIRTRHADDRSRLATALLELTHGTTTSPARHGPAHPDTHRSASAPTTDHTPEETR